MKQDCHAKGTQLNTRFDTFCFLDMVSRDERCFIVVIHANDIKKIVSWVLKHPAEETGGDLFGSWEEAHEAENTLNIQYVIGPGELCRRTTFSFHQDVRYASKMEVYLNDHKGMEHVALWHSHQTSLDQPSTEDENMVWNTMPSHDINRFVLMIANIADRSSERVCVTLKCFLFQIDQKTDERLPVLLGMFRVVSVDQNEADRNDIQRVELEGAECLITEKEFASVKITETETSVIGCRKI